MNTPTKSSVQKNEINPAIVHSATDYILVVDRNFKVIMANNLFKKEFNFLSGGLCYSTWKDKGKRCKNCPVKLTLQDGKIHQSEKTVLMKNGKTVRMLFRSTPLKDNAGDIVYILESATDITGIKLIKEGIKKVEDNLLETITERIGELQKSKNKYRTIFDHSRDAIILTSPSGRIMEINQAGVDILRYRSKNEILTHKSAIDFFENKNDLLQFQNTIANEGVATEFETRLKGNHDYIFDALITSSTISDKKNKIIGYVIIIRDIIKIKQAQQQIEKQNIKLAALNNVSSAASSSLNLTEMLNGTIEKILEVLDADSARIYLLDHRRETLILNAHTGHSKNFIKKSYMKRRKIDDGLLGKTVISGKATIADNVLRSGDPYVSSFSEEGLKSTIYIPLLSKGNSTGVMCLSSHTDFKSFAEDIDFLTAIGNQIGVAVENAHLYEDIKKAYLELKSAQEQVIRSEKLASLGKLAATIAHEINNPLAAVLTYIRLMMKLKNRGQLIQERESDIARYLTTMERETARCGDIVKNLLDFSRQSKISIGTFQIEEIINRVIVLLSHDFDINNIDLHMDIQHNLPDVKCDFKQIQQVLLNLMSNASEAMTDGGTLTVTARESEKPDFLDIIISDTGTGISSIDQKNIFEPFFTTKEEGKGVGLGLSVVYGIITKHNGSIDVESEPGKKTSFTVQLPTL